MKKKTIGHKAGGVLTWRNKATGFGSKTFLQNVLKFSFCCYVEEMHSK